MSPMSPVLSSVRPIVKRRWCSKNYQGSASLLSSRLAYRRSGRPTAGCRRLRAACCGHERGGAGPALSRARALALWPGLVWSLCPALLWPLALALARSLGPDPVRHWLAGRQALENRELDSSSERRQNSSPCPPLSNTALWPGAAPTAASAAPASPGLGSTRTGGQAAPRMIRFHSTFSFSPSPVLPSPHTTNTSPFEGGEEEK